MNPLEFMPCQVPLPRLTHTHKGYCPLCSCPVWCPYRGEQQPHGGKAGGGGNKNEHVCCVIQAQRYTPKTWKNHNNTLSISAEGGEQIVKITQEEGHTK